MHTIDLDIEPMPCPRPRVASKPFARAYMPSQYTNWKDAVARLIEAAREKQQIATLEGPLAVTLNIRATKPRTSKLAYPKPDADNYAKSILDACTDAGLWGDDTQVVNLEVFKRWRVGNESRVRIKISRIAT
jgi:Holliday junction resolvase RusA-like endonuclease